MNKLDWVLGAAMVLFLAGYLLFSGWSTSLDFKIEKISARRLEARQDYEQTQADLAQAQSRDALAKAASGLNLVEISLANGYVDIRPLSAETAAGLANIKQ
ncbi:MAG: hypothetical protein HYV54_00840 [Parcubacteria group bacterium]|nr:hypothetical protein [Parcubacteria group bacterium]